MRRSAKVTNSQHDDSVGELAERKPLCGEPGRTAGRSAPPDFLKTVASVDFMRLSNGEPHTSAAVEP